ncbi:phage tail fiber protein [Nitrosomonas communis]|uniref:Uncharacterized protein n=1 Tax=Nitrosomonas communis TaxID=44574 RepID=A0A1I4NBT4_9PROT|nr:hypothetical protein [Nitrosomonas communis]SFM12767.1 hypothetical protein SAMN05421863_101423 [Nitrosomonas communis]
MSSATNVLEESIGNHLLRTATWPKPAGIYIALFTTLPLEDGTGGVEVSGGNYARVQNGPSDTAWNAPTGGNGEFSNAAAIVYGAPNANWGNVVGAGIYDASTGGTLLAVANLDTARNIVAGDPAPNFPAGALKFIFA